MTGKDSLDSIDNALMISMEENPRMQVLHLKTRYVHNGKIVRTFQSKYKRDGVLNIFSALVITSGSVSAKITSRKIRNEFLTFMDEAVSDHRDVSIHAILDNHWARNR